MNTDYQPPRGERLQAELLDRDGQRLSIGEAFLYIDRDAGAIFQILPYIQGDALQKVAFLKFSGGCPISILRIEECTAYHGPYHLSFEFVS